MADTLCFVFKKVGKTWHVVGRSSGDMLGLVVWSPALKEFIFNQTDYADTAYTAGALSEIVHFLKEKTKSNLKEPIR